VESARYKGLLEMVSVIIYRVWVGGVVQVRSGLIVAALLLAKGLNWFNIHLSLLLIIDSCFFCDVPFFFLFTHSELSEKQLRSLL